MGGGILPIAIHNQKLYFLFGREVQDKMWGDFGGGREGKETRFQDMVSAEDELYIYDMWWVENG